MQAKTLNYVGSVLVFTASISAVPPAGAVELWEIFTPVAGVQAPEMATAPEREVIFASDLNAVVPLAPVVGHSPNDTTKGSIQPSVQEPITPMVFASDQEANSSPAALALAAAPPATLGTSSPTDRKELWALFAPGAAGSGEDHADAVSPLAEVLLESGELLRVTQAMEEIPNAYSNALTFPTPTAVNAVADTALDRPIFGLTLNAAVRAELMEGIAKLDGDRAIQDLAVEKFGSWEAPHYEASIAAARFAGRDFHWAAPAFYSRPLYFEQPNLERYGHHVAFCEHDNFTQSAISAAHFFATIPVLPYAIGANTPDECSYVLGSYRPGSCNPHQLVKPPKSLKGLIFEGIAVTGLVFLIP